MYQSAWQKSGKVSFCPRPKNELFIESLLIDVILIFFVANKM